MKYEINFDNNTAEKKFLDIDHYYTWSERNFEDNDLARNVACTITFENAVKELRLFGADVDVRSYNDNGFLRIGYARINALEFFTNGEFHHHLLKMALWEIAHPKTNKNTNRARAVFPGRKENKMKKASSFGWVKKILAWLQSGGTEEPAKSAPEKKEPYVYVTVKGKKYHYDILCPGLRNSKAVKMDLSKARKAGYTACDKCCYSYLRD